MQISPRHHEILSTLKTEGRVAVTELAERMQVSDETIRRDLKELEALGLARRIHGGAITPRRDQEEPLLERGKFNMREKARIAQLAGRLVGDGMAIFLDTGTTTLALARRLAARRLRVTTNSLDIAMALRDSEVCVEVTPGTLRANDNALVGIETLEFTRHRCFDLAFMGIAACTPGQGWMDYAQEESALRRVLLAQARQSVLLADSSKFGRQAYLRTFALDEVKCIVSDRVPPAPFREAFDAAGIQLVVD
jgi:DeoR family glycerol-3-phosphate regulon repressor